MRTRAAALALVLAGVGLGAPGVPARAQALPSVSQLTVSFWPEYDRTDVLVLYRLHLADSSPLPTRLQVPVPSSVQDLNAVATRDADGRLVDATFTRQEAGDVSYLIIDSNSLDVQVEYYLPLARTGDTRSFAFTWPGGLAVSDFSYEVQQPVGASNLSMEPAAQGQSAGEFGLTYQKTGLGPVDANAKPTLSFSYTRSSDQLSADLVQAQTPIGTPEAAGGRTPNLVGYLPWALLGLGLALMVGGAVYYVRTLRPSSRGRRRHPRPAADEAEGGEEEASPVYCHNCGARASASDRFCRRCGTQLRR